jgi:hypothetical protein
MIQPSGMQQFQSVSVREDRGPIVFPDCCPVCLQVANIGVLVEKTFARVEDSESGGTSTLVGGFLVPFCEGCVRRHAAEDKPLSPWLPVRRVLSGGTGLGGLFVFGIGLFFLKEAILRTGIVLFVVAAFVLLMGSYLVVSEYRSNRHLAVRPRTSVTRTVEFSDVQAQDYEPPWRTFQFENAEYGRRFAEWNAARLWNPAGVEARAASEKRRRAERRNVAIAIAVFVPVVAYWLWDDVLRPYAEVVRPYWRRIADRLGFAR